MISQALNLSLAAAAFSGNRCAVNSADSTGSAPAAAASEAVVALRRRAWSLKERPEVRANKSGGSGSHARLRASSALLSAGKVL